MTYLVLLLVVLFIIGGAYIQVKSDAEKAAKDEERRIQGERALNDIREANDARRSVHPDDGLSEDPYNRDNQL